MREYGTAQVVTNGGEIRWIVTVSDGGTTQYASDVVCTPLLECAETQPTQAMAEAEARRLQAKWMARPARIVGTGQVNITTEEGDATEQ